MREQLERLGVKRLLLAIHDVSFPSDPDEDIGRGSPVTRAAGRLYAYLADLGFTGIQLGPQGQTARANPSPYDGTIFSRNVGNIALASLRGLVSDESLQRALYTGDRADLARAFDVMHALVAEAHARMSPELRVRVSAFRAANPWIERDALHAALCDAHGGRGFRDWPERDRDPRTASASGHAAAIERYCLGQLLVHEEHARLRARLSLVLYGDLQVGYSDADAWAHQHTFLTGWRIGAPPSRTNPEGQPWGYPVLDPDNPASLALVVARAEKALVDYDSLRVDHPHGLICPWVYRSDDPDAMAAVRAGSRLHESPDRPELARYAIARADQLDPTLPRHADRWVRTLDDEQVTRYARYLDPIVERARADLSCEVLSTMPAPLERVLQRHGLGRWRVTQKANLDDPTDVYRTETVAREDWLMLGNHDTAPILTVIAAWPPAKREQWARHLAARLSLHSPERLASDGFLATCMLAELFISRAENVQIFFADLFGYTERFNIPGLVDPTNWTLRLPPDFASLHAERLASGRALDLPLAVDLALSSRECGSISSR